jgi:hypothetical protein
LYSVAILRRERLQVVPETHNQTDHPTASRQERCI